MKGRIVAAFAVTLALAGCHHARRPAIAADVAQCDPTLLKVLLGRPASSVAAAEALELSGARTIRWIDRKGMATMDYRPDRLNVILTSEQRIRRFTCG